MDAGGSWVRLAAVERGTGRILWRERLPRTPSRTLSEVVRRILRRHGGRTRRLTLGVKGIWNPKDRRRLAASLSGLAGSVAAISDLELGWLGALGEEPGVLILAGTGSCAYGRDRCGHAARAGGLGPLLGDEGSAFWIGRAWLKASGSRRSLGLAHDPEILRKVAALAPKVLRKSDYDPNARRILESAWRELRMLAEAASRPLHFKGRIPLSWQGGLFEDSRFREGFLRRLQKGRWEVRPPRMAPELAGARFGWKAAALPCYNEVVR